MIRFLVHGMITVSHKGNGRLYLALPGIFLLAASLALSGCSGKAPTTAAAKKGDGGGAPVMVAKVAMKDVPVDIQVIGNVEAYSAIAVKAQVGGELTQVSFKEGDYVKKGDLLFSIDPRATRAQLQQVEANLMKNKAQLQQTQANLERDIAQQKYAEAQAARYAKLMQEGVISKEQAEQVRTNSLALLQGVEADKAAIESARAEIAATQATVENVRVQLGYTEVRSPIDGRTGSINVKQGNVVTGSTVDLMTINQVQPIYVTFAVPESQLRGVKRYMEVNKLQVIAIPQDDEGTKETGVLTFVDNNVDMSTGTIKLKGTFANADRKLWPGEFVRVTLRLTTQTNALVVPNQAVQTGQDGPFVFVVKADRTVESRAIATGARIEDELVVEKGLEAGETVVTEGHLRLAPGTRIQVRDGRGAPGKNKKARPAS
ncbi:MAG: efflux RND transporter periplasmic adaptor subunit [Bryobacteraceae bacterium]